MMRSATSNKETQVNRWLKVVAINGCEIGNMAIKGAVSFNQVFGNRSREVGLILHFTPTLHRLFGVIDIVGTSLAC